MGILDEGLAGLKKVIGQDTALIVGVQPTCLGIIEAPGNWGADIVVGEGQPFGIGPTAGGPIYGLFACSDAYLRQMPGRIVGKTRDSSGKPAFCLTLSTREQHIRRQRATSNICSNETLIALMGAMHMAMLGPQGLADLAVRNAAACESVKRALAPIAGISFVHDASHYNEFAIRIPGTAADCLTHLDEEWDLTGGFDLGEWFDGMDDCLLVCATDQIDGEDIDELASGLASWCKEVGA